MFKDRVKNRAHGGVWRLARRARFRPAEFATRYESCIVQGAASQVVGEEKQRTPEGLVHKYSADFVSEGLAYIEKQRPRTRVLRIAVESITGKARR